MTSSTWPRVFLWKRFLIFELRTSHMTNDMKLFIVSFYTEPSTIQVQIHTIYESWYSTERVHIIPSTNRVCKKNLPRKSWIKVTKKINQKDHCFYFFFSKKTGFFLIVPSEQELNLENIMGSLFRLHWICPYLGITATSQDLIKSIHFRLTFPF